MQCPYCDREVAYDASFCPHCGKREPAESSSSSSPTTPVEYWTWRIGGIIGALVGAYVGFMGAGVGGAILGIIVGGIIGMLLAALVVFVIIPVGLFVIFWGLVIGLVGFIFKLLWGLGKP